MLVGVSEDVQASLYLPRASIRAQSHDSEMSQELLNLKGELQNGVPGVAEGGLEHPQSEHQDAVQGINTLKNKVQETEPETLKRAARHGAASAQIGPAVALARPRTRGACWKALFGKEADKLEQANDDARTFYIIEREPLSSHLYSVTAHWHKGTTLMIKFEEGLSSPETGPWRAADPGGYKGC
ncbi:Trafficking protein particle complex subunit 5 [Camelus dromedarius]|uniref:Trafficking protein particle complex subunit 5 n=1 Tax=Camelus dromedarius TaxID=9838 RepID=A0A5N4CLL3_CAMDR|nr:Trafficking protein particle complex subunit 5 [Camelus dromedarius]